MLKRLTLPILKYFSIKHNKFTRVYLKLANLDSFAYADFLKQRNFLYRQGNNNSFNKGTNFTDPQLVSIGSNCIFSDCTLLCHDGTVGVLNTIYNEKFDSIGKIEVGDNVFIGHGAIVMPNVTIASNVIVAAGAVVTKDVKSGDIVAGVPAKPIARVDDYAAKIRSRMQDYPWLPLILQRQGAYDSAIEDSLLKMRQDYFYKNP